MIKLTFDVAPVAKERPRFTKAGSVYTPTKTAVFEKTIRILAAKQMRDNRYLTLSGPLVVDVIFQVCKPKSAGRSHPTVKPDIDNLIKSLFDSLNGVAWEDDAQVCSIHCTKAYGEPKITIRIAHIISPLRNEVV